MSPAEAYNKCFIEKKRIPELEGIISTDPEYSYYYAYRIIKGRFESGEKIIITDYSYAYYYALNVMKGRFREGEKNIATHPECSYWYAHDVLKSPFHLCHHNIFNSEYKELYINFLKSINYDTNEISEWLI